MNIDNIGGTVKIRTTMSVPQALLRLAEAAGWRVKRSEKSYLVFTPGSKEKPIPKTAARALAFLAEGLRGRDDWPQLRDATAYAPRLLPSSVSAWEQAALQRLTL